MIFIKSDEGVPGLHFKGQGKIWFTLDADGNFKEGNKQLYELCLGIGHLLDSEKSSKQERLPGLYPVKYDQTSTVVLRRWDGKSWFFQDGAPANKSAFLWVGDQIYAPDLCIR